MRVCVATLLGLVASTQGCSNILVSKGASAEGAPHFAYAADDEDLFGHLRHYPAQAAQAGRTRKIWDWDSGTYLGEIDDSMPRYNVVGNMNEHGLAIGETTFGGLSQLAHQTAKIDYGSLIWVTLGRTKTAREAIHMMYNLTQTYGYYSQGETFSLADTEEVWMMDFIGKGQGEKGAVFIARRLPKGSVTAHANQARIRTWDWTNTEDNIWAPDVVDFAKSKGLYPASGKNEDFSFSDTYDPVTFSGARLGEARAYSFLSAVSNEPNFAEKYLDYAQGYNLTNRMPVFVFPKANVSVNDTMWHMRTHFDGTWFDESKTVGAGAYHARVRGRPLTWDFEGNKYLNERTIGVQQTGWHFVAQSRGSYMPAEIAPVIYFAVDDTSTGPHVPLYATATAIPQTYAEGNGDALTFELRSAHWIYNMVANMAYFMWDPVFPWVQSRVAALEAELFQKLAANDAAAAKLIQEGKSAEAVALATKFSVEAGDYVVDTWIKFYGETFVRFHDFANIVYQKPKHPMDKEVPSALGVGFDDAWKQRIVNEAGDKLRFPKTITEHDHTKLKFIK